MTFEKMTTKAQEAVRTAVDLASRRGNPEVHPEHLCLAVVEQEGGVCGPLIQKAGGDPEKLVSLLERRLSGLPQQTGGAEPRVSSRMLTVLQGAEDEAKAMKDDFVSTEHMLLAAAKHDREITRALEQASLDRNGLLEALSAVRGSHRITDATPRGSSRPWRSTASISPPERGAARSIR